MNRTTDSAHLRASALELGWEWFHRAVAVYGLLCGLAYWARLIGFYEGTEWRFDLMPVHWQVASVTLAVLFPFAASGLWMVASWGAVIWFLCAAIEVTMYAGFPELFGAQMLTISLHILIAAIYCAFSVAFRLQKRRLAD